MEVKLAKWSSSPGIALTALVGVTAVWGYTFVAVQDAIGRMPVMDFLAWRFAAAGIVMLALRPGCVLTIKRGELWRGVVLGIAMGAGYIAQTYGLLSASAAVSGFITGMFVVLTPVMAWVLLRHKTDRNTWWVVALATLGVALLSLNGWAVGIGEMLTLLCAVFFAVHIVGLGEWSPSYDPYTFALIQVGTVAVLCLVAAAPDGITMPPDMEVWGVIAVTAVFATALAFIVQTWAQSLVPATRVAVVMTMEPVFAGLFGVLLAGNQMTWRTVLGGVCIVAAMLIINLKAAHKTGLSSSDQAGAR